MRLHYNTQSHGHASRESVTDSLLRTREASCACVCLVIELIKALFYYYRVPINEVHQKAVLCRQLAWYHFCSGHGVEGGGGARWRSVIWPPLSNTATGDLPMQSLGQIHVGAEEVEQG